SRLSINCPRLFRHVLDFSRSLYHGARNGCSQGKPMVARVATVAFQGIEAVPVSVQVQFVPGLVAFLVVGLPDKAVGGRRERVRAPTTSLGLALPPRRIIVNLAPADLPKEGSHFDLPIALALLASIGVLASDSVGRYAVLGELALDGSIAPVTGVLPAAMAANALGLGIICPRACGPEAAWAGDDLDILAADNIIQILNHFRGTQLLSRPTAATAGEPENLPDLRDIKGQESAKRALEVAEDYATEHGLELDARLSFRDL